MIKFNATDDWVYDVPAVSLVLDNKQLTKRASAKELLKYEKTPNQTDLHIIALGAYEGTGANRNEDIFLEEDCIKNHHYFKKAGRAVHRHHKNKPNDPKFGNIKASAYNAPMKRIELIVGLDNDKCADILEEQEKTGNTNWSMASTPDPNFPVLTARGYVPLTKVEIGDLVLTHTGKWRKVTEQIQHQFTGTLIKLSLNGLPEFPELTADHPLFATVFPESNNNEKQFRYFKDPKEFDNNPPSWYHVEHLKIGDRLYYRPTLNIPDTAAFDDENLATFLGYYTAEGSLSSGVQLTCNLSDSLPQRVPKIINAMFEDVTVTLTPHPKSKVALNVNVYSSELVRFCEKYVGRRCENKFICNEMFGARNEVKLSFLGAWLDGDGFIDKKGLHISSCNYTLILQGRDLLMTMGIPSSIYKIDHAKCETSGMENSGFEYTLNVAWLDAPTFVNYSWKVRDNIEMLKDVEVRKKPACLRPCKDGLFAYRISGIQEREVEDVTVYNLEVEEDNSYSLGGILSHNSRQEHDVCTFCHHKAKDDNSRCEHIPRDLGKINKLGVKCGMVNPNPKWFEISYVRRPADRIGMSLKKLAGAEEVRPMLPSDYLQLYTGFVPPEADLCISKKATDKREILQKLSEIEKHLEASGNSLGDKLYHARKLRHSSNISPKTIDELRKYDPHKVLRILADKGIVFSPEDFSQYIFGDRVEDKNVKGMKAHLPGIFQRLSDDDTNEVVNDEHYEPANSDIAPKEVKRTAERLSEEHSLLPGPAIRRMMRITIVITPKEQEKAEVEKTAFDKELAKQYIGYKLAALQYMNEAGILNEDVLINAVAMQQ